MGTALTGQTKASTYDSLLKITDNGPVGGTEKVVTDGLGNESALQVGTAGISSTGTLAVAGVTAFGGAANSSGSQLAIKDAGYRKGIVMERTGGAQRVMTYLGDGTSSTSSDELYTDLLNTSWNFRAGSLGSDVVATISGAGIVALGIDDTPIGGTTPESGAFTTLAASGAATLNTLASSGATLTGGTINNVAIGGSTPAAGAFTTLSASSGINSTNVGAGTPGTGAFTTLTASGVATLNTLASSGATLTGGTINSVAIGGSAPAAGAFTTLSASSGINSTNVGAVTPGTGAFTALSASTSFTAPFVKQSGGNKRLTSDFSVSGSTTLADVTDLTVTVIAGETYSFEAELFGTVTANGGYRFGLAGTATATDIRGGLILGAAGQSPFTGSITALGDALGYATASALNTGSIRGTITVNVGGTLVVQFAQSNSSGDSVLKRGSYLRVTQY